MSYAYAVAVGVAGVSAIPSAEVHLIGGVLRFAEHERTVKGDFRVFRQNDIRKGIAFFKRYGNGIIVPSRNDGDVLFVNGKADIAVLVVEFCHLVEIERIRLVHIDEIPADKSIIIVIGNGRAQSDFDAVIGVNHFSDEIIRALRETFGVRPEIYTGNVAHIGNFRKNCLICGYVEFIFFPFGVNRGVFGNEIPLFAALGNYVLAVFEFHDVFLYVVSVFVLNRAVPAYEQFRLVGGKFSYFGNIVRTAAYGNV